MALIACALAGTRLGPDHKVLVGDRTGDHLEHRRLLVDEVWWGAWTTCADFSRVRVLGWLPLFQREVNGERGSDHERA